MACVVVSVGMIPHRRVWDRGWQASFLAGAPVAGSGSAAARSHAPQRSVCGGLPCMFSRCSWENLYGVCTIDITFAPTQTGVLNL
jgi:hypothetical protein